MRTAAVAAALVLTATARLAAAQSPADAYPTRLVDRPLVMPDGVTSIDADVDAFSAYDGGYDLGDLVSSGVGASHAFGRVEPFVGFRYMLHQRYPSSLAPFDQLNTGAVAALGDRAAAMVGASVFEPFRQIFRGYDAYVKISAKQAIVPHALAVYVDGGYEFTRTAVEQSTTPAILVVRADTSAVFGNVWLEAQATDRLSVAAIGGVYAPFAHDPAYDPKASVRAAAYASWTFGRTDVWAQWRVNRIGRDDDESIDVGLSSRF